MNTVIYFSYNTRETFRFFAIDAILILFISGTAFYAIKAITSKNEKAYFWFSILRLFIEIIKISKCILILNGINASFTKSAVMLDEIGNIKFYVLV
jgi:hypothetical protein